MRRVLLLLLLLAGCPEKTLGGFVTPPADGTPLVCPVTGASCTKAPGTEAAVYEGRTFYFCSDEARRAFGKSPGKYAYQ